MASFRSLAIATLVAVYILILVGGIVRSTGSGMGCPDWPRCFGSWVPPTSVSQLPDDYKDIYAQHRHKKNVRFAKYLNVIGMSETADRLMADKSILQEADFNPVKTWIEYGNRIVGVIIGVLIFAVAVSSLKFRRTKPILTIIAFSTFVLVVFQGWIGSFVVSTNLTPWTVTVHMFLALVIVALLVFLIQRSDAGTSLFHPGARWWLIACIGVVLVQILLGTELRESVDMAASQYPREQWIDHLGAKFVKHRSFSWIVLILHIGLVANLRKTPSVKPFSLGLIVLILGTILTGVGLAYFAFPAFLQPVHLLLATVVFGFQFMLLLKLTSKEIKVAKTV